MQGKRVKNMGLVAVAALLYVGGVGGSHARAESYNVDYEKSYIAFSGMHAGEKFVGRFKEWKAEIDFDPENLGASKFRVEIQTKTAHTGNKLYDGTLKGADWFDVKHEPEAIFITKSIAKTDKAGIYKVDGVLSIRNIARDVSFEFEASDEMLRGGQVESVSQLMLKRLDFDIGKKSDAKAEWVENDISLTLSITASGKGE